MKKETAVVIFIDDEGNILLQERDGYSKGGERHGYFGGNIEVGEKPKDALKRELKEELNYVPKNIKFWKQVNFVCPTEGDYKDFEVEIYIFISPLTKAIEEAKVYEGEGSIKTTLSKELESNNITGGYNIVLKEIKEHFEEIIRIIRY
jgi:mutator protein MutT